MDGTTDSANKTHRTIFADLLESNIPESAKSIDNMTGEAQIVLGAGSVTTAHTLATMTYHMLANPDILARARKEITDVMPQSSHQPPDLHKLEALPYFVGPLTLPLYFPILHDHTRPPAYKKACDFPTAWPAASHVRRANR